MNDLIKLRTHKKLYNKKKLKREKENNDIDVTQNSVD